MSDKRRQGAKEPRRRCNAKCKDGHACQRAPLRDATRCRRHGGLNQQAEPGDPIRGGRPPTTFLYVRHLRGEELQAHEAASVGGLDDEIRIARVLLDTVLARRAENPNGGVPVFVHTEDGKKIVRIRPWSEIIDSHLDKIRRLELARAAIAQVEQPGPEAIEDHRHWLASVRRRRGRAK